MWQTKKPEVPLTALKNVGESLNNGQIITMI